MVLIGIFLLEIFLLYLFSRFVTQSLSVIFLQITRSHKMAVALLAFLFFPGVVIHELSHFFIATLLFVKTGAIEFMPKIHGQSVKLGSVQIEKTDPIRRFFIGVAPFLIGIGTILGVMAYLLPSVTFEWESLGKIGLFGYFLFVVSNSMFSSKRDMEGAIELIAAVLGILILLYFLGVRVPVELVESFDKEPFLSILQSATFYLVVPLGIDVLILLLSKLLIKRL